MGVMLIGQIRRPACQIQLRAIANGREGTGDMLGEVHELLRADTGERRIVDQQARPGEQD